MQKKICTFCEESKRLSGFSRHFHQCKKFRCFFAKTKHKRLVREYKEKKRLYKRFKKMTERNRIDELIGVYSMEDIIKILK